MAFTPKPPKFTIPTLSIGAVCYPEKKAVGVQFIDPDGGHVFVSFPGALLRELAAALVKAADEHPEANAWPPAPYARA
jgi:hypothetical protein